MVLLKQAHVADLAASIEHMESQLREQVLERQALLKQLHELQHDLQQNIQRESEQQKQELPDLQSRHTKKSVIHAGILGTNNLTCNLSYSVLRITSTRMIYAQFKVLPWE